MKTTTPTNAKSIPLWKVVSGIVAFTVFGILAICTMAIFPGGTERLTGGLKPDKLIRYEQIRRQLLRDIDEGASAEDALDACKATNRNACLTESKNVDRITNDVHQLRLENETIIQGGKGPDFVP